MTLSQPLPARTFALTALGLALAASFGRAQQTTRILAPGGVEASGTMTAPFIAAGGETVVFSAGADNLIPIDQNGTVNDVFAYDVSSQTIELVSRDSAGNQANALSFDPVCSDDGRFVAYWSFATNLSPGDNSSDRDVFLFDRATGETKLVSPGPSGFDSSQPYISPNGAWIVFVAEGALLPSDTNGLDDVYVFEVGAGKLTLVSLNESGGQADAHCRGPVSISNSGKLVSFETAAKLVAEDKDTNVDVYLRDLGQGTTIRPGKPNTGARNGFLSADGEFFVFESSSDSYGPSDGNSFADIYLWEVNDDSFSLVSLTPDGQPANNSSFFPRLSGDGRYVVYSSNATNLTVSDTNGSSDLFLYDQQSKQTVMVDVATDGTQANLGAVSYGSLSDDGERIAYASMSTNLVPNDTTTGSEVMITSLDQAPETYCVGKLNSQGCVPSIGASGTPSVSSPAAFSLTAVNVLNQKNGLFFYGLMGAATIPLSGGTLCLQPPLRRTQIQPSGGNVGGSDCTGQYTLDFTPWLTGTDPNIVVGVEIHAQAWMRDPASSFGVGLTNGIRFVALP